jgi:hypothetical protein
MYNMYFLFAYFFLPLINAVVVVKIHRSAIYKPVSACAFLRNTSWSSDASAQSCIWECVYENNCQTAVYFSDEKVCSMFTELCKSESIQSSGNVQASVICHKKNHGELVFCYNIEDLVFLEPTTTCSSTVTPSQAEVAETTVSPMTTVVTSSQADVEKTTVSPIQAFRRRCCVLDMNSVEARLNEKIT